MTGISVIIPVFNGEEHLRDAVNSVIAQTLQPLELFLVDDGSVDNSVAILEAIDTPFPKRVLKQNRKFQSAARNLAAAKARGKYLAFLDHDDIWYPKHLERLVAPMELDERVGWVYSDMDEIDGQGQLFALNTLHSYSPVAAHPKSNLINMLSSDQFIFPSAALVRKTAFDDIGGFDERLSGYEDDDLFLRLFRAGWLNEFLAESLLRYRRHASSSSFSERMWISRAIYAEKLQLLFPDEPQLARYYVRDIIAPRFFRTGKTEYFRHLAHGRWDLCVMSVAVMREFLALMQLPPGLRRATWAALIYLMNEPRMFARLNRYLQRVPRLGRLLA